MHYSLKYLVARAVLQTNIFIAFIKATKLIILRVRVQLMKIKLQKRIIEILDSFWGYHVDIFQKIKQNKISQNVKHDILITKKIIKIFIARYNSLHSKCAVQRLFSRVTV